MISFEDFKKLDLRAGKILSAERVENSDKLIKLAVDLGEENPRQILAGIGKDYELDALVGKQIVVVANLEPRKLMRLESNGMLLAASDESPVLLTTDREVPPGAQIS